MAQATITFPPISVSFEATLHRRSQDADGEWTITLKAPMSASSAVEHLGAMLAKVLTVSIEYHAQQIPLPMGAPDDEAESNLEVDS